MAVNNNADLDAIAAQIKAENSSSQSNNADDNAPYSLDSVAAQIKAESLPPKPESIGSKVGDIFGDIAVGGSRFGAGITSAPHNIAAYLSQNPTVAQGLGVLAPEVPMSYISKKIANLIPAPRPVDYEKSYGIHPGLAGKALEGISQYAPFIMGGGASLPGQVASSAMGSVAAQSKDPMTSAAEGGLTALLTYGGGLGAGKLLGAMGKGGGNLLKNILSTRLARQYVKPSINNLLNSTGNSANLAGDLNSGVKNALEDEQGISKGYYKPLNESNLNLRELAKNKNVPFPQYKSKLLDIAVERQNLKNIFGQASEDLSPSVISEAKKGFAAMDPPPDKESSFGLGEVMTRAHSLGKLATVLSRSDKYAASRLFGLKDSLISDTKNILESSGHEDLSNQLTKASDHYRDNVVPFYNTRELSKIATSTEDRPYYLDKDGYTLAKDLHNKNNSKVLNKLSDGHKNGLLGKLLTLGKGDEEGQMIHSPEAIAGTWKNLDVGVKQVAKEYNPKMVSFLNDLTDKLSATPKGIKEATLGAAEDALVRNVRLPSSFQPAGITSEQGYKMLRPIDSSKMPARIGSGSGLGLGLQSLAQPGMPAFINWMHKNL